MKPAACKRIERQQAAVGSGTGADNHGEALVEQDGLASRWKKVRTAYRNLFPITPPVRTGIIYL